MNEIEKSERKIFELYKKAFKNLPHPTNNVLVSLAMDVHTLKNCMNMVIENDFIRKLLAEDLRIKLKKTLQKESENNDN